MKCVRSRWMPSLALGLTLGCADGGAGVDEGEVGAPDSSDEAGTTETSGDDTSSDTGSGSGTDSGTGADVDTSAGSDTAAGFVDIPLTRAISHVQPMTGIVLWNDHELSDTPKIQLEYAYTPYADVASTQDPRAWDWSAIEDRLDDVASHGHQAILRLYYAYPGSPTAVPQYIKALADYEESTADSEGQATDFPDWSHPELATFTHTFHEEFAARYDEDPRLAFLQVGFGLWGEYHIYDPGEQLGVNFPSKAVQAAFTTHMEATYTRLPWSVSIDAADDGNAPFADSPDLLGLRFGLFDDSFLHELHGDYNASAFALFGPQKRLESPVGGELSYYTQWDQEHALDPEGPHGIPYEELAAQYNVSYMIGNDQPGYQTLDRIEAAGVASGYSFRVTAFSASPDASKVTVINEGIAPIYTDAYVAVDGVRAQQSLMVLMPGDSQQFEVAAGGAAPELTIACDHLVAGQEIEFAADL